MTAPRCGRASYVGVSGSTCAVYAERCGRWTCPRCGHLLQRDMRAFIAAGMSGHECSMVTVTFPAWMDAETSFRALPRCWKRFHERLVRRTKTRFAYVAVAEAQGRGVAHLHVLVRGVRLAKNVIRETAIGAGFGQQVHVRPADAGSPAYVTKSLLDVLPDAPRNFRRVRWSPLWAERSSRPASRPWDEWQRLPMPPDAAEDEMRRRGYTVIRPEREVTQKT